MSPRFNRRQLIGFLLLVAGASGLLLGKFLSGSSSQAVRADAATQCRVLTFYDGDTLGCDLNSNGRIDGNAEHIRLLGIDAPEMYYSKKNHTGRDQPFAREALQFVKAKTQNRLVRLEMDQQTTDRYGRRLAFLYAPGEQVSINRQLVSQGLARLLFIPPNDRYHAELRQALQQAQKQHMGQWGS